MLFFVLVCCFFSSSIGVHAAVIDISNVDGSGFVQGGTATVTGSVESTENAIDGVTYQVRDEESQGTDSSAFLAGTRDLSFAIEDHIEFGANYDVWTSSIYSNGKILIGGRFTSYKGVARSRIARLNADGSLDTSFDPGTGANAEMLSSAIQSDEKILMGGQFTTYNGISKNYLVRINTDGSLDTSFDTGTGANNYIYKVAILPDGKIIIVGFFTAYNGTSRNRIARLNADGSLDTSFDPGTGADNIVYTSSIQSDGKILVGGYFTTFNGTARNRIARLNANGSLDTSFDPGTGANDFIWKFTIQPDGKILTAGNFTSYNGTTRNRIARLNTDGTHDTSFDPGTGANSPVYASALQTDGKFLIGGNFTSYNGTSRNYIARLNTDGTLDTSFAPGTGANNSIYTVEIQTDGKILIGGSFTSYNGTTRNGITRLNSIGTLDITFDPGKVADGAIRTSITQADGKILIGGDFISYNGNSRNRIARISSDGTLDTSFNPGTGANNWVYASALQADGKILIAGNFTSYNGTARNYIARINSDGTLDTSFDPGTGLSGTTYNVTIQTDGKILVGGTFTSFNGTTRNNIVRLNSDGSLDTSFDPGTGANGTVYTSTMQSDGKIVIGGSFTLYNGTTKNRFARLNTNGSLDTSFDSGVGLDSTIYTSAIHPDGRIIIGGSFTSYKGTAINKIARLNTDGSLDATFVLGTGPNSTVTTIVTQPDGKIIIGGSFSEYNGTTKYRVTRLNTTGELDTTFDTGTGPNSNVTTLAIQADGKVLIGGEFTSHNRSVANYLVRVHGDAPTSDWNICTISNQQKTAKEDTTFVAGTESGVGPDADVRVIIPQNDGKMLIGGSFTTYNKTTRGRIARITADGALDTTFQSLIGANSTIYDIDAQADGKLIIVGGFTSYNSTPINRIVRLDSDGLVDTTFNPGTGANNIIYAAAIQTDGKIIIVGNFTTYNSVSRVRIARINTNGSLDTSFNPGTGATTTLINAVDIQTDGKIIIGGSFTLYNGTGRNRIARINTDGTLDTSFNPGTGANSTVSYLKLQSDGKVLAGGQFTTYNGSTRNRMVRINTDGTVDTTFDPGTGFNATAVTAFVTQTDGKIIAGGSFTTLNGVTANRIARLNSDGTADATFATGTGFPYGTVRTIYLLPSGNIVLGGDFESFNTYNASRVTKLSAAGALDNYFNTITGPDYFVYSSAVQSNGKILIGGDFIRYNGAPRGRVARLNSNGSLDTPFDTGTGANAAVLTIAVQSDEKVIIGGQFTTYNGTTRNRVARLNTNGTLDTSFDPGTGANNTVRTIAIQSDGKILISGDFTSYNGTARGYLARLNLDGSFDSSFVIGTGANSAIQTLKVQSDGKILIAGSFGRYNGTTRNQVARLNLDGSLDTSFDPGTGANNWVYASALQADGKILIGGYFTSYNGTTRNRVARINTDGSLDTTFDPGLGLRLDATTSAIAIQADGKIVIAGQFYDYNSISRNRIARINTDGSLDTTFDAGTNFRADVYTISLQPDGKLIVGGRFAAPSAQYPENIRYITRLNTKNTADFSCLVPVLALAQGHQSVYLRATDASGNIFIKLYQWIVDTKNPSGLKVAFDKLGEYLGAGIGGLYSKTREFTLYFNPSDKYSDISYIKVSENKDFKGAKWREYDGDIKIKLEENKKTKLYIKIKDEEGNVSDVFTQTIYVDTLAPTLTVDELADGLNPILSGTTETGSFVKVWVNSQVYGQDNSVPADGKWEVAKTNLLNTTDIGYGSNVISIETEDQAGNKTTTNFEHYIALPIAEATVTQTAIEEPIQVLAANTAEEVPPAQPKTTTKPTDYIRYAIASILTLLLILGTAAIKQKAIRTKQI